MRIRAIAAVFVLLVLAPPSPRACTTFCFADALVFGKNYDWNVSDGLVIVNKRGVVKQAAIDVAKPFTWTSRFGSLTFNQYGREFPCGGVNEKGLVIELMWLDDTRYLDPDGRGELPTLQWIQYQLDTAADVAGVIASDKMVRVSTAHARIHFLIADASGATAAVEYLDGKMVVHTGARALTNDTYEHSLAYASSVSRDAGLASNSSLNRFCKASAVAQAGPPEGTAPVDAAFDLLARVAQGNFTQWSIVYDIGARRVFFRTQSNPAVREVNLSKLDFSCATPVQMIDVNTTLTGDITSRMSDYSVAANRRLIGAAYGKTEFLRDTPRDALDQLARFPEAMRCAP